MRVLGVVELQRPRDRLEHAVRGAGDRRPSRSWCTSRCSARTAAPPPRGAGPARGGGRRTGQPRLLRRDLRAAGGEELPHLGLVVHAVHGRSRRRSEGGPVSTWMDRPCCGRRGRGLSGRSPVEQPLPHPDPRGVPPCASPPTPSPSAGAPLRADRDRPSSGRPVRCPDRRRVRRRSATPTSTPSVATGGRSRSRSCPATRSSAGSWRSARRSPRTRSATASASAASSAAAARAPPACAATSSTAGSPRVPTYAGTDRDGSTTQGGYSTHLVVDQHFVLSVPAGLDPAAAAPLLCAGITTYSPLKRWGAGPGRKVAVVGLGGLGHMAVKIAHAMGAEVTVLSQSLKKQEDGLRLGADHYHATSDPDTFELLAESFDLILNTVSARDRRQRLPGPGRRRRRPGQRRRPGGPAVGQRVQPHRGPPLVRRLDDRRDRRDPGDARLLRRARDRVRHRADRRASRSTRRTSGCSPPTSATASCSTPRRSPERDDDSHDDSGTRRPGPAAGHGADAADGVRTDQHGHLPAGAAAAAGRPRRDARRRRS